MKHLQHGRRRLGLLAVAWLAWPAVTAAQREVAQIDRPRFMQPVPGKRAPQEVDVTRIPILRQRVSLDREGATVAELLGEITRQTGLRFAYNADVIPLDRAVPLRASSITVAAALLEMLVDARVDVLLKGPTQAVLLRREARPPTGALVGRVLDAKTNLAVPTADVFLDGTRWRTVTDAAGWYRLMEVDTGRYTLVVRRLGYARQRREVTVRDGQTDTADVTLEPVAARLEELVTTATGRQRRLDIANDVTILKVDSIMETAPITSVTDLLEGRVPGLTVQHTSGAPGDPARLRLRGGSSLLRNNDPIVILDGVRFYAEQSAARSGNLASRWNPGLGKSQRDSATSERYATPSPLDYIDPNTIETIEVFKGPSATTQYGPDAANGVIVITTKKGKAGPTRWTANVEHGRTTMAGEYPELLYRWGHDIYEGVPVNCPVTGFSEGVACVGDSVKTFQLLSDPALTVLDRGHRSALSLGASGGTQALTYAVTGSYADETGLIKLPGYEVERFQSLLGVAAPDWMRRPQHLKQWGATSVVTARLGSTADVSLVAMFTRTEQQRSSLERQLDDLMSTFLDRSSGIYYRQSPLVGVGAGTVTVDDALSDYYERATASANQFTNSVDVSYRPRTWLTLGATAGINVTHRADRLYFPRGPANFIESSGIGAGDTTGYVSDGQGTSVESTVKLRATAKAPLGRQLQFRFVVGGDYAGTSTNDVANGTRRLAPGASLQGDSVTFVRRGETADATFGWFAEPSVGNDKFNFSSGLRLDGGRSFGAAADGLSLPKFPKLGFTYAISEESWFPLKNLVPSMRIRLSYGRASRQPGPKDRLRLYNTPGSVFAGGEFVTGVTLQTLGNTEVRPERTAEFEGGLDADLFDSRVFIAVSGYRQTTDDALVDIPVAPSVDGDGLKIRKNIGVTRNTGLELDVGAQLVRSARLTWTTQVQVSQNRNVVVELGPNVKPFYIAPTSVGTGVRIAAGYPLFGRWTKPILGYADANDNGVIEPAEVQLGDTAVYVGSSVPNYTASLYSTVSLWGGAVSVSGGLEYVDGLSQRNEVARRLAAFSAGQQDPAASLTEQIAMIDLGGSVDYNWMQTVSTLRFKSLAINYRVPPALARRLGAQRLVVAVKGSNLGLRTNYRGLDPNVNAFGTGNDVTDTGVLPEPRRWQLGVSATY